MENKKLEILLEGKTTALVDLQVNETISIGLSLKNKDLLCFHTKELEKIFDYSNNLGIDNYKNKIQERLNYELGEGKVEVREYNQISQGS